MLPHVSFLCSVEQSRHTDMKLMCFAGLLVYLPSGLPVSFS